MGLLGFVGIFCFVLLGFFLRITVFLVINCFFPICLKFLHIFARAQILQMKVLYICFIFKAFFSKVFSIAQPLRVLCLCAIRCSHYHQFLFSLLNFLTWVLKNYTWCVNYKRIFIWNYWRKWVWATVNICTRKIVVLQKSLIRIVQTKCEGSNYILYHLLTLPSLLLLPVNDRDKEYAVL